VDFAQKEIDKLHEIKERKLYAPPARGLVRCNWPGCHRAAELFASDAMGYCRRHSVLLHELGERTYDY